MTTAIDQSTVPLLPSRDTVERLRSFSDFVYRKDESSALFKIMDALTGDGGVGTLKKELLIARLSQNLDTTYFTDLDNVFGNLLKLSRLQSETYSYNPSADLLTTAQWDEIKVKDAWYRQRIKDFFTALGLGGTPDGLRMMVRAAIGVDTEIYELWRFQDHYAEIYDYVTDIETIQNPVINPSFETDIAGWVQTNPGTTPVLDFTSGLPAAVQSGTFALRWSTGTSASSGSGIKQPIFAYLKPSKAYNFSFYAYRPAATTVTGIQTVITYYNAAGSTVGSATTTGYTLSTADTKVRYNVNFTTPASTAYIQMEFKVTSAVTTPSALYYLDAMMITPGTVPITYFDGDTSGYRWTGARGGSISVQSSPIDAVSRLKVPSRNEVIVYPYKSTITSLEQVLLRTMLKRLAPVDSVITVANSGYAVNVPIPITGTNADSTFFQVQRYITAAKNMYLTADEEPNASLRWMVPGTEVKAPQLAFAESQEFSQYYVYDDANRSSSTIDTVTYTSIDSVGHIKTEKPYTQSEVRITSWGPWMPFEKADSPDNYPGGKLGKTPSEKPALTRAGKPYVFQWTSQAAYVAFIKSRVLTGFKGSRNYTADAFKIAKLPNGQTTDVAYRYPLENGEFVQAIWKPELAVVNVEPPNKNIVVAGWFNKDASNSKKVGIL